MSIQSEIKSRMKPVKGKKISTRAESVSPKRELPSFSLSEEDLPEIKNWKVGGKYRLLVEVEQVSLSKGDYYITENNKKLHARFQVKKILADSNHLKEMKNNFRK